MSLVHGAVAQYSRHILFFSLKDKSGYNSWNEQKVRSGPVLTLSWFLADLFRICL